MMALVRGVMARSTSFGIEVEGGVFDIHVNRFGADIGNGPTRGDEGERRGDDFIARPDAEHDHGDVQGGGAAVEAEAMFRAEVFGEILFELDHIRPEAEGTIVESAGNGRVEIFAEASYLRRQIEIRNGFAHRTSYLWRFTIGINPNESGTTRLKTTNEHESPNFCSR